VSGLELCHGNFEQLAAHLEQSENPYLGQERWGTAIVWYIFHRTVAIFEAILLLTRVAQW
jgi:hypothetical protein